ncbi:MAG: cation-binding protein, partial [Tetrasphaera sp.]|nr:cation-binding protein [Tetrasphaera sp.]
MGAMIPHVPEPVTGDIVQLILDDHRLFEALLRELRLDVANREVLRACFADVVLAHGEAEEQHVYTSLQRR